MNAIIIEDEYLAAAELERLLGEVEALCSLTDARGDLIRIAAAVKSIQADKRAIYFRDTRFVERWMIAATQLINRWGQIKNYLTE